MKKTFLISAVLLSGFFFAQSFETYANPKISEIQKNFKFKKYSKALLEEFSKKIIEEPNEIVTVSEFIPGEIIGWKNSRGSYATSVNYQIKNGKLIEIETFPNNEKFLKNLNKYAPKNSYFELNSIGGRNYDPEFVKKQKNGEYILSLNLLAVKNGNENSDDMYDLEYGTADFKNFKPLRIKKSESKTWTIIK